MVKTRQSVKNDGIAANAKNSTSSRTRNRTFRASKNCVDSEVAISKTKSNKISDENDDLKSSCSNNKDALQAQCKVIKNEALNKKSENKARAECKYQKFNCVVKTAKTRRRKVDELNNAELQDVNQIENLNSTVMKSTIKTRARKCESKSCNNDLKSKTGIKQDLMRTITPRSCTVKLKKLKTLQQQDYMSPSISKCSGNITLKNKTKNIPLEISSTSRFIRQCVVKVKKNAALSNRLRNIAIPNRNVENREHTDFLASKLPISTPLLDDTKCKNVRKLCSTSSCTKLKETQQPGNTDRQIDTANSNHENRNDETKKLLNNNNDVEVLKTSAESNEVKQIHSEKTKINDSKTIKHLPQLSLKRPKNVKGKDITRFEPQQNSTICFEPLRNSTVLELDLNKNQHQENQKKSKKTTPSKDGTISKNLANKSEEIENLLNSLDDDDCVIIDNNQNLNNSINDSKKFNKFFHNKKGAIQNILKEQNTKCKTQEAKKKRRFHVKRSTIAKRDNIYEFFSQSQTSDSDNVKHADPTADIIKKLIEQGKVRVATNCKGKGKPVFKRKKPTKQTKKGNQKKGNNLKKVKSNTKKVTFKDKNMDDAIEDNHFTDDIENDELAYYCDKTMNVQNEDIASNSLKTYNHKNPSNDQEGTFSRLARKVLINQAGRSDKQRNNASTLLDMVKNIVSTPKNKTDSPQIALSPDISPIPIQHLRPSAMPSPWRVVEEEYFPRTFNFSRSSGNLPSFSSDFIPSTLRKIKAKENPEESYQHATKGEKSPTKSKQYLLTGMQSVQNLCDNASRTQRSVISSFSSNDSNGENIPPPGCTPENYSVNDTIFDLKQLPNPRRNLKNRNPLKTINILEVVHLPPFDHPNKKTITKEIKKDQVEMFLFEKNLVDQTVSGVSSESKNGFSSKAGNIFPQKEFFSQENVEANNNDAVSNNQNQTLYNKQQDLRNFGEISFRGDQTVTAANAVQSDVSSEITENNVKHNLFGFEEFLPQSELSSQESIDDTVANNQNHTIHEKLQNLRKLKPNENELQIELLKQNSADLKKRTHLFNDDSLKEDFMRQRGIKEILCSTMLNSQPSTSKEALRMLNKRNFKDQQQLKFADNLDLTEFFKDPEPETTFNENEAHRTYIRPYKRKRRLRENKYVFVLDSDVSEDEYKANKQHCREPNSFELSPKKKRNRKAPKETMEDIEFIEEFNEMVKDVDAYELIVEKST